MESCVAEVMAGGKDKSDAVSICRSRLVKDGKKDVTLSEREGRVRASWSAIFKDGDYNEPLPWLQYIFDDYAVFTLNGDYWKIEYSWEGTQAVFNFESIVLVEHTFSPIHSLMVPHPIRSGENNRHAAYAVVFSSDKEKDLHGTWFDHRTSFYLDWFSERPWLYHHGLRPEELVSSRSQRIGTWDSIGQDEIGVFVEGELDLRHQYVDAVKQLLDDDVLFPSSGTLNYLMKVAPDGHVMDWPIVEVSSTVAPSEFRMKPISEASRRAMDILEHRADEENRRYMMSIQETLEKLLARRSAGDEDDGVDVEGSEEAATEDVTLEVPEGEEVGEEPEEGVDEAPEEVVSDDGLTKSVDALISVVQSLDAAVKKNFEDIEAIRDVVEALATEHVQSVKSAIENPESWQDSLFVATRAAASEETVSDEEAADIRAANQKGSGDGATSVFAATRVD
jgi:hypothetical protein